MSFFWAANKPLVGTGALRKVTPGHAHYSVLFHGVVHRLIVCQAKKC